MRDAIALLEFVRDEPTVWVLLLVVLIAFAWLYRERLWWRERALYLEEKLMDDTEHRDRIVDGLRKIADMQHLMLDRNQSWWPRRWRP